jgi:hypothetical protein
MSTVGALLNLFWSTFTVKAGCSELVLYWEETADVFNNAHGTGTSLLFELAAASVFSVALDLLFALAEVLAGVNESRAKSIWPELALMMTSWMVPTRCRDESLTCAPTSLLARTQFSVLRPVALSRLVLQLRFAVESLDCMSCDCAQTDAAREHAAHIMVNLENAFFIARFISLFWFEKAGAVNAVLDN